MTKSFFCLKINQRESAEAISFVTFVALAKDIESWTGIKRVGEVERGTQRLLKQPRVNAIKRYFSSNQLNTIPVNVILAFGPGIATFEEKNAELMECLPGIEINNLMGNRATWGLLSFEFDENVPEIERPAIVVDGQHRIRGMAAVDEDIPIIVAAFIEAGHQEQAFQFVVINNKAQKVPTENVKAIISDIDIDELQSRLLQAGVSFGKYPATLGDIDGLPESPFYHLLAWPLNPTDRKIIQLTTIESCLRYIKISLPVLEEDDASLKEIFIDIWRAVSTSYPVLWLQSDVFMSKVNLLALNEFILDKIDNSFGDGHLDIYIEESVMQYTKSVLETIPVEFWQTEWVHPLQDNVVIRNRIKDDLRKISQNNRAGRAWNENLQLIPQE